MTRKALAIFSLLLAALACTPVASQAATRSQVIKDCADDERLQGSYTIAELRDARQNLDGDVKEYTGCSSILRRAEQALRRAQQAAAAAPATPGAAVTPAPQGGTPADEPDGNDAPTQFDKPALDAAKDSGDQAVDLGGVKLVPASGVRVAASDLPSSLVAALVALLVAGLALAVPAGRHRLLRRRR